MQRLALVFLIFSCATVLAAEDGTSVSRAFKRVDGAVVVVRTASYTPVGPGRGRTVAGAGIGSGVLISQEGKVLTAAHVVQAADAVVVEFRNGETVAARVVSADSAADVALLEVEHIPRGIAPVALGDSDRVEVGDQVFVVGTPFGMSHTLTVGHVSARRNEPIENPFATPAELFQTDAALNAGNSGGPMFNLEGEVIGIVSVIVSRSGGSDGLGFAVTSNAAWRFVIDEPSVWSGVQGFLLIDEIARAFNVPGAAGLLVQHVATGSPAERLGLRSGSMPVTVGTDTLVIGGDVVIAVDGIALGAPDAQETIRRRLIEMHRNGAPIRLTVLRGGELLELTGPI
jgi:S1-C subfamily serine protease